MGEIGMKILENYGLIGFCVFSFLVFFGWVIKKILNHLMGNLDKKDEIIKELGDKFSTSLDSNTKAINCFSDSHNRMIAMNENFHEWLRGAAENSRREHIIILDHVQRRMG